MDFDTLDHSDYLTEDTIDDDIQNGILDFDAAKHLKFNVKCYLSRFSFAYLY
jgi:hypothetical protein